MKIPELIIIRSLVLIQHHTHWYQMSFERILGTLPGLQLLLFKD